MPMQGFDAVTHLYEGGQAVIYRARRAHDGLPVVLKVLRGPWPTADALAGFRREAEITAQVAGEGVIGLHEARLGASPPMLVLQDFGARSLADHFPGAAPVETVLRLGLGITRALERVHAALVIHKDVNPSNVVWNPDGDDVRLIDFGISSTVSRQRPALARPEVLRGTLAYMSPEQTGRMNRSVDYRSDFYSLGATLYRLLTGSDVFPGDDALELVHAHVARAVPDPRGQDDSIPDRVAEIVMKLLSKTAEERYQSAGGLAADLARCLEATRSGAPCPAFVLGRSDHPGRVQIPERLYGRAQPTAALLEAVGRVTQGGREVVLVAGYSGVGKTSLVNEIHRPLARRRDVFVAGKCDQFRRGVPFSALTDALGGVCQAALARSDEALKRWLGRVRPALGDEAGVLTDLIPALETVLGPQPEPAPVPDADGELRLHRLFRRLLRALAAPGEPVVLFLDDLQWADLPTIRLLEQIASDASISHLMIIGAYRENEVDAGHPLTHAKSQLRDRGVPLREIVLEPLPASEVLRFVQDALRSDAVELSELASLCHAKTGGNPYFLAQFLRSLEDEGLLRFRRDTLRWAWSMEALEARSFTDNVVDFMAGRIRLLPEPAGRALSGASILGSAFDLQALGELLERPLDALRADLAPALEEGLVVPVDEDPGTPPRLVFGHDRVQQAAYGLLADEERERIHARIGRHMAQRAGDIDSGDALFQTVTHLNAAARLLGEAERARLIRWNLAAGQRATRAAAYGASRVYLNAGLQLLGADRLTADPDLACRFLVADARAASLLQQFDVADRHVAQVLEHATDDLVRVSALEVKIAAHVARNETLRAIETGAQALALLGFVIPSAPDMSAVGAAMTRCGELLASTDLTALSTAPELCDPAGTHAMTLLMDLAAPAYVIRPLLLPILAAHIVQTSIRRGIAPQSGYGFALYGLVLCGAEHLEAGYALGSLGVGLTARFPAARRERVRARHVFYGFVRHWKEPLHDILEPYVANYQDAVDVGDYEYAAFCGMLISMLGFHGGRPLDVLEPEMMRFTEAMKVFQQDVGLVLHGITHQAGRKLMGLDADPLSLTGAVYDEAAMVDAFVRLQDPTCLFVVHLFRAILAFAMDARERAEEAIEGALQHEAAGATAMFHRPVLHTMHALLALWRYERDGDASERARADASRARIDAWAAANPSNLAQKSALLAAEWARVDGDEVQAGRHYEAAVAAAHRNRFLNDEGLANELAGRFYLGQGRTTIARAFLLEARQAYVRWGAAAVVQRLDAKYPELAAWVGGARGGAGTTTGTFVPHGSLDAQAAIRAGLALSQEIVLSRLLATLVRIALEASGARTAVLLMVRQGAYTLAARGLADPDLTIEVPATPPTDLAGVAVPRQVLEYVRRTGSEVLLADAAATGLFTEDPYIKERGVRSVLALPVSHKGQLRAVLYLENDSTAGVFAEERLELSRLLLAQAAISIENAQLYESLEEKVRERTEELEEARNDAEQARRASESLLENVLPRSVAEELKSSGSARPVHYASASVLFTDVVDFTTLAEALTPQGLVDELEELFSGFDAIVDRFGVEKLKTIGDSYMAVAGIPRANRTHPVDLALVALAVDDLLRARAATPGRVPLAVRMGIHTGPLVAGVIGRRRLAYDVWGDTVNTASRLESSGVAGRINVSQATRQALEPLFQCTARGRIAAKGKGEIEMHFLDGIRPEFSADPTGRTPNPAFWAELARLTADDVGRGRGA